MKKNITKYDIKSVSLAEISSIIDDKLKLDVTSEACNLLRASKRLYEFALDCSNEEIMETLLDVSVMYQKFLDAIKEKTLRKGSNTLNEAGIFLENYSRDMCFYDKQKIARLLYIKLVERALSNNEVYKEIRKGKSKIKYNEINRYENMLNKFRGYDLDYVTLTMSQIASFNESKEIRESTFSDPMLVANIIEYRRKNYEADFDCLMNKTCNFCLLDMSIEDIYKLEEHGLLTNPQEVSEYLCNLISTFGYTVQQAMEIILKTN